MAARLAEAGFTASTDALEHPQGFLHAISPTGTEDRTSEAKPGENWAILTQGIGIKKYPTCYCTHRAIDCVLDLVNETPIKADDVKKVTVNISDYFATILRNHQPDTGLAAKFSMEFAMASGIVAKRVGLRELTDEFVQRPEIQALMRKVEIVTSTEYDPELSGAAPADQVTVELADGKTIAGEPVKRATGHASRPLTEAQIFEKFADCLDAGDLRHSGRCAVQTPVADPVAVGAADHRLAVRNQARGRHQSGSIAPLPASTAAMLSSARKPMALRVSIEPLPICGDRMTLSKAGEPHVEIRLGAKHIQAGGEQLPGGQRVDQRVLVHQAAARYVHQHGAVLQLCQCCRVDDFVGRRSRRCMQRQEVAVRQHVVERGEVARALLQFRRAADCANGITRSCRSRARAARQLDRSAQTKDAERLAS